MNTNNDITLRLALNILETALARMMFYTDKDKFDRLASPEIHRISQNPLQESAEEILRRHGMTVIIDFANEFYENQNNILQHTSPTADGISINNHNTKMTTKETALADKLLAEATNATNEADRRSRIDDYETLVRAALVRRNATTDNRPIGLTATEVRLLSK